MTKIFALSLMLTTFVYGGFFDDIYIYQAQKHLKNNKLDLANNYFFKVEDKSDEVYYNIANIFYKQGDYKKAIFYYKKIHSSKLFHKKFHNIGNSYMKQNKLDKAIYFYKKALKIEKTRKTKDNLELANSMKLKEEMKELRKIKKNSIRSGFSQEMDIEFDDNDEISKQEKENYEDVILKSKNNITNTTSLNQNETISLKNFEEDKREVKLVNDEYFSDIEEKKWDNLLKDRKMNTLIIPLNKEEDDINENISKPW